MDTIKEYIRSVPDFPKPGVTFYDITTLLQNPAGFRLAVDEMEKFVRSKQPQKIIGIESRGFVFASVLADRLNVGLALVRKPGKLPYKTIIEQYDLEYGSDSVVMHIDAVERGERTVVVDDLIATGGTLQAVCRLVERLGGEVMGISAVVDLAFLPWRERLAGYDVNCLISYESE
ncbi:MAG: adenine phosphoribosyltransferase [Candidatus Zixiibacteriota bacterium]